jgi:hypothetical protein
MSTARHPALRIAMLVAGVLLIVLAPVVGALPGPGGIFLFAGGLILVLRASRWARHRWARLKRRWPKLGGLADKVMRRRSARRRAERLKTVQANAVTPGPSRGPEPSSAAPVALDAGTSPA